MKKIKLSDYQSNRFEKLDSVIKSINIEKRHHAFLVANRVNLSAFVRDSIDAIIEEFKSKKQKPKKD